MQTKALQAPVALFVFRRPDTTRRVFDVIAKARPMRLFLIADGPRTNRAGETELCREVREIVTRVDWPCEVVTNFSATNLGCQERMISGLDWVFSLAEEAIILEDDCLPDLSFFRFCQELLERYRGDNRVAAISGTNLVAELVKTDVSYFFSQLGGNWGWASWRSEWQKFDRYLEDWPDLKAEGMLSEVFDDRKTIDHWTSIFDMMYQRKGPSAWDYQWLYSHLKNNRLTIIPRVNLVTNIGFGITGTHTMIPDRRLTPSTKAIDFPLRHPIGFFPLRSADRHFQHLYDVPLSQRVSRRLRILANPLFR